MNIVIIEDEQLSAQDLADYITEIRKDYKVIKIISSVKEAVSYFKKENNFQLVFSDIQLGDGLSFEIFKQLELKCPVIFCTAYNSYAIEAFKSNGIDYILKPFHKELIREAIEKFEMLRSQFSINPNLNQLLDLVKNTSTEKQPKSVLVYHKDKIIPIKMDDIALFYIKNELTFLLNFEGKSFSVKESLEELETMFSPTFFRANRQYFLNRRSVKDLSQHFSRKLLVNLTFHHTEDITVSKEKSTEFLKWLES